MYIFKSIVIKVIISFFFILILTGCSDKSTNPASSEDLSDLGETWELIDSGDSTQFQAITFSDKNTGYIAGYYGNVLKTSDGGDTWSVLNNYENGKINSMTFLNKEVGIATYNYGEILKTTNSGQTWESTKLADDEFFDISFFNDEIGIIVGPSNIIYKTVNGGASWQSMDLGFSTYYLNKCQFINSEIIFISGNADGENGLTPLLLKSTNGGTSFNKIEVTTYSGKEAYSMYFINKDIGFMVGPDKLLIKTINGGNSWEQQVLPDKFNSIEENKVSFHDILFVNEDIGFAIGGYDENQGYIFRPNGFIIKTNDGGNTWYSISIPGYSWFSKIYYSPGGQLFIVGDSGLILESK